MNQRRKKTNILLIFILLLFFIPLISGYDYGVDLSMVESEDDLRDLAGEWDYALEEYVDGDISDEDYHTLKDLFNNKVNLNTVDRGELYNLPDVTYRLADRIIAYRERYGPFENIEDVKNVPGVKEIYDQIVPFIEVRERRAGGGGCARLP